MEQIERLARAIELNKLFIANKFVGKMATEDLIRGDTLTLDEINTLVVLYPNYEVDKAYLVGDVIKYDGKLYEIIQEHTSQASWLPNEVASLYKSVVPEAIIPEWDQPTGGHDAYNVGDRVVYNGSVYESLINANTWSPEDYPDGWLLI